MVPPSQYDILYDFLSENIPLLTGQAEAFLRATTSLRDRGVPDAGARPHADVLIDAEPTGRPFHGLTRMPPHTLSHVRAVTQ